MLAKVLISGLIVISSFCQFLAQSDPGVRSARIHALGGVGVTLEGIDAIYTNPAGLTMLDHTTLHLGTAQSFGLSPLSEANAGAAVQAGKHATLFATAGQFGFEAYQERLATFGYARQLADNFSAAIRFDAYQFSIEGYGSTLLPGFLIGIQYKLGNALSFGATARNPFLISTHDAITLPTILTIGIAYIPSDAVMVSAELEKDVDFVARFRMGVEYQFSKAFIARIGTSSNPGTFHAGVGFIVSPSLEIDLAAGYHTVLGYTPALGIIFSGK